MKKKHIFIAIGCVLVIIVLGVVGFFLKGSVSDKSSLGKVSKDKEYVYDVEYDLDFYADSYKGFLGETYYAKNVHIPYINIDSKYAKEANEEIKNLSDKIVEVYNNGISDESAYVKECDYSFNKNKDVLSVSFKFFEGFTGRVVENYYVYNFNMSTGEKASLNEVLASVGKNKNSFKSAVHTAITSNLKNIIGDIKDRDKDSSEGAYFPQGKNFETYNQASISYFDDLLANDKVTCLIGDNNSLYTVIVLKTPNELEDITMLVNIK